MSGKTLKEAAAEKLGHVFSVRGITIENVTKETVSDFDFIEIAATLSDPDVEDGERLRATAKYGPAVFGKDQWKRIKSELRKQNDGRLTTDIVMSFITEVLAALNSKNF